MAGQKKLTPLLLPVLRRSVLQATDPKINGFKLDCLSFMVYYIKCSGHVKSSTLIRSFLSTCAAVVVVVVVVGVIVVVAAGGGWWWGGCHHPHCCCCCCEATMLTSWHSCTVDPFRYIISICRWGTERLTVLGASPWGSPWRGRRPWCIGVLSH